jgi:tetratricopeptide (TPR) repeat protein
MLLREVARYEKCGEAFVVAEEAAALASDPELSHAIVPLSRALLNIEPDVWRPEEARALLERAERAFARRDPDRLMRTKTVRGMLALRSGDFDGAASVFAEVLASTPRDKEDAYADALRNSLWAAVQAGRMSEDLSSQIDALEAIDERRGRYLNVLRDRWMQGLVYLAAARHEKSVALLRDSMRGFEARGDPDVAVRVGIDAVRALLASERYKGCVELCRDLVSRSVGLDQREPTRRRALTAEAITYLRDAAQRESLTDDLVQSVGAYVDRISDPSSSYRPCRWTRCNVPSRYHSRWSVDRP